MNATRPTSSGCRNSSPRTPPRPTASTTGGLWLGLNTYAGKNLWTLLAEARQVGVALVHSAVPEPLRLVEEPAAVGLDLASFGAAPVPAGANDGDGVTPAGRRGTAAGCPWPAN